MADGIDKAAERQAAGRRDGPLTAGVQAMRDLVQQATDDQQAAAAKAAAARTEDLAGVSKAVAAAVERQAAGRTQSEITTELTAMQGLVRTTTSELQASATAASTGRCQELSAISGGAAAAAAAQEKGRTAAALTATLDKAQKGIEAASDEQATTAEAAR